MIVIGYTLVCRRPSLIARIRLCNFYYFAFLHVVFVFVYFVVDSLIKHRRRVSLSLVAIVVGNFSNTAITNGSVYRKFVH